MADKKVDYNDILCQAIDTIVSRKIENLDYDKTIICTITDDSDASNGHYVVNDGSISFDAYSEDTSYVVNDSVYVTVPKGDFTQTKIIISKYTANNNTDPISYVSPLQQVYLVTDNLVTAGLNNNSILANGPLEKESGSSLISPGQVRLIWEQDLTVSKDFSVQNNGIFDTLAVKAKFKCGLGSSFRMKSGHYGIIIELYPQSNYESGVRFDFSTDEMFGNPYMFLSFISQQKKIDISNLGTILRINVYLYQSRDFIYRGDEDIEDSMVPTPAAGADLSTPQGLSLKEQEDKGLLNNIFVDDLEIYFGMDLTKVNDNTFTIYSNSDSTFNMIEAQTNSSYNQKNIVPVWFNKIDDGNYIGFSDGIYDFIDSVTEPVGKNYTEEAYLLQAKKYERGAKLPRTDLLDRGIPSVFELLQLYSYGQDVKSLLEKIYRKINTDINKDYNRLMLDLQQYQTAAQKKATSALYNSNTGIIASNSSYRNSLTHLTTWMGDENINNSFTQLLQNILIAFGTTYTNGVAASTQYNLTNLNNIITNLTNDINNVALDGEDYFTAVREQVTDDVVAVWNTWKKSFDNDIAACRDFLAQIQLIMNTGSSGQSGDDIVHTLSGVNQKFMQGRFEDYEAEHEEFVQAWANRYCIYWYRYVETYFDENEQFMPKGWQRLDKYTNQGLPEGYTVGADYNKYYEVRPTDPRVIISVGDASVKQEQIQAILFYDHQMYKSNILTFYNENPVIDENTADSNKGLYIQLTDEEIGADGSVSSPDTYNSKETYQLYGITNYLVNQAERYTRRKLRARYKGLNKGDEYLRNDCTIYWYVPVNSTMLDVNHAELMKAGFSVYDPTYIRGKEDLEALIAGINLSEMTQAQYQAEVERLKGSIVGTPYPIPPAPYKNNYIEGYLMVYKDISLNQQGELDIESTEFFYQIKPYYVPTFTNNTIRCRVVKKKTYIYEAEQYFTFASYGTSGTDYSLSIVPATNKVAVTNSKNGKVYPLMLNVGLYDHNGKLMDETSLIEVSLKGTSYNGASQQTPVIVGGTAPEISVSRLKETSQYGWAVMKANVSVTIHYDANGKPTHDKVIQENNSDNSTITNESGQTLDVHPDRVINLESYYPIPWSAGDYYIEGASTIVYDSLGTNPSYYPDPYVLFDMATNQPVANQRWEMVYYPQNQLKTSLIASYLPKMKQTNGDYCLQVPTMYLDDNNYVCSAVCKVGNSIKWVQPILIIKNRFSSPMMNDWDGSLTVDEKNGTILSSMVGAGKKEDDNTFSGVLMGDVATRTNDGALNPSQQGMYGFNHGEQSFAFKNDGTAFIGKAGKGRIEFDGNSGKIQSSSYSSANVGMMIDLDDGEIDMMGGFVYDTEHQSDQWVSSNPQSQNNNEINGYENTTRYKPTGSRVTISVNDPFLHIVSPSIVYNTEALDGTYNANAAYAQFWSTIDYYDGLALLIEYLNQSWNIYDAESYFQNLYTVKATEGSGAVTPTQLANAPLTYMPKAGGYIKIGENLKVSNLSSKFKTNLYNINGNGQAYAQHGEDTADVNDDIILYKGDYLKLIKNEGSYSNSSFKIEYLSKEQAGIIGVNSQWPTYDQYNSHVLVGSTGRVKTSATQGGLSVTISNYNTVQALANAILNEAIPTNPNNYQNSLKYKFLTWQDRQRAIVIYNNGPTKDSKDLMYVGTKEYYLQTDNYKKGTAANHYFDGEGLKFDLMRGTLDAYNFTLFAADNSSSDGGGSYIKLSSSGNPYFQVSYNGDNKNSNVSGNIDLIKITKNDFILQSQNYYSDSGNIASSSGTQIDLKNGKITSYDFDLIAYDKGDGYEGSYFKLSNSGNPYIQVHYKDSAGANLDLLNIGRKKFLLQSQNWNRTNKTGIQFDFREGKMMGYDFYLYMESSVSAEDTIEDEVQDADDKGSTAGGSNAGQGGKIVIDSSDKSAPFLIQSTSDSTKKFKIYWDGSFGATAGIIGGWRVNETSIWSHGTTDGLPNSNSFRLSSTNFKRNLYVYSADSGSSSTQEVSNLRIAIGQRFGITNNGTLYGYGAYLDNITVKSGQFSDIHVNNGYIGAWQILADGRLKSTSGNCYLNGHTGYISGGYIDGGTVDGAEILGGSIDIGNGNFTVDSDGNVTMDGDLSITGVSTLTLESGSKIEVGGSNPTVIDGNGLTCRRIMVNSADGSSSHYLTYGEYEFSNYFGSVRSGDSAPASSMKFGSWEIPTKASFTYTSRKQYVEHDADGDYIWDRYVDTITLGNKTTYSYYVCTGAKVTIKGLIYSNESSYEDPYG